MKIQWYPICGYEQEYAWNPTTEEVRGLKSGIVLKWQYDSYGRPYVNLCKNGVARHFYKAMLIYSHAHQVEIPRGFDVHHIDFNKDNNDSSNLLMLSHEEHMKLHGFNEKAVIAVDEKCNVVHRFASTMESERNGFNNGNVSCACRGCYHREGNHKYKGLRWFFEEEWLAMC